MCQTSLLEDPHVPGEDVATTSQYYPHYVWAQNI